QKLKKQSTKAKLTLELVPTVDILATIARDTKRPALVIGFAAETEKLMTHARTKRAEKGCDWLLANSVAKGAVFGEDGNTVTLLSASAEESWPSMSKHDVAQWLVSRIADHFSHQTTRLVKGKRA